MYLLALVLLHRRAGKTRRKKARKFLRLCTLPGTFYHFFGCFQPRTTDNHSLWLDSQRFTLTVVTENIRKAHKYHFFTTEHCQQPYAYLPHSSEKGTYTANFSLLSIGASFSFKLSSRTLANAVVSLSLIAIPIPTRFRTQVYTKALETF